MHKNNLSVDIAKLLIDKGADINRADSYGMTALMYACKEDNTAMLSY